MLNRNWGDRAFSVSAYIYLTLFMLFCLFPFWIMIVASFTDDIVLRQDGYLPWARVWSLEAYRWVFKGLPFAVPAAGSCARARASSPLLDKSFPRLSS